MDPAPDPSPAALRVSVVNGNLRFVRQPLMLGHYRSIALTGTERVMDDLIGGAMGVSLGLEHYPELPGTTGVFINTSVNPSNPLQFPRPQAVVVVGLGDEGNLRAAELTHTVRQGVIAWARRLSEQKTGAPATFELAATLIGSGGTGVSAGQSASLVAEGVVAANERLAASGWPTVSHLQLIELYLDRATEAWRALRVQAAANPGPFQVDDVIATGAGALRRPIEGGYRGTRYDLITAVSVQNDGGDDAVSYVVDTRRARAEVHAHAMQRPLLRDLVARGSNDRNADASIGRTLFRLLVPVELEPFLAGSAEAVIELDRGTAGIPWELLDTAGESNGSKPWALSTRLLRKLRTQDFRRQTVDATTDSAVLVIGEPACDDPRYPRLPGAREEARIVTGLLEECEELGPSKVTGLFSPDPAKQGASARKIVSTLLLRDWRVVHIAGHGEAPEGPADPKSPGPKREGSRGVVLSGDIFLGGREIRSMRVVPELVFVNCCHLAAHASDELLREDPLGRSVHYDRARFAASVAEELIAVGVRCVVAAGWAVEDEASQRFATTFYDQLIGGARFIDAVAAARRAAHELGGNTWAAYQCYGDPDWAFLRATASAAQEPVPPAAAFANLASPTALALALETLAVNGGYSRAESDALPEKLEYLETRFGEKWGGMGEVAEAFGAAWAGKDRRRAAEWYRRALAANDGRASLRAAEQLGNFRVRSAWESVDSAKPPASGGAPDAEREETLDAARREIRAGLAFLEHLADDVQSTIERESLCGSAWKRLALLEEMAERPEEAHRAVAAMRERYARAEALARETKDPDLFYPALNRMAAELITEAAAEEWGGFEPAGVEEVRASLRSRAENDPDFWSVVGLAELRLYEAVARRELAGARASLEDEYADLHRRVGDPRSWASAYDQLQFVLSKYGARATAAEREAGDALLALLRGYAGRGGPG